ncbi:MAG: class F sortase, partial [Candidatus Saccharimonadales bacterium]
GEIGSAVIDGHYGWIHNLPAVFDNLHAVQKGDSLYIRDEQGVTMTFVVRDFREFTPGEDATSIFRSSDGKVHLNLITCKGTWNQDQKSYSNRFVVFTDKV